MTGVYLFLKNSSQWLNNVNIRKALVANLNVPELLKSLEPPIYRIYGPLLPEHQGYHLVERPPSFDPVQAQKSLEKLGWKKTKNGWLLNNQSLSLTLTTQKDTPYVLLAQAIQKQLEAAGFRSTLIYALLITSPWRF